MYKWVLSHTMLLMSRGEWLISYTMKLYKCVVERGLDQNQIYRRISLDLWPEGKPEAICILGWLMERYWENRRICISSLLTYKKLLIRYLGKLCDAPQKRNGFLASIFRQLKISTMVSIVRMTEDQCIPNPRGQR